jgi:prefoldin subunit 5
MDSVLQELSYIGRQKEQTVEKLDSALKELEKREQEIKQRIEALQNVPLPVAEHFAKLVEPGERRSAKRDYLLFGSGVVVTTVITIVLQLFSK